MKHDYDVVIVGGGMVGATLAVALAQCKSLSIALIEAQLPEKLTQSDAYDNRVSALTMGSETLLKNLTIWSALIPSRISPFSDMKVWEQAGSELHYDCAEMNAPWLGHLLENRHIQQAALTVCQQQDNIDIISPARPVQLSERSVGLDNGQRINARLIVAADGAQSHLRALADISTRGWSYQQKGLVATVTTREPHQQTAWQRFLAEGPLAFLPLPAAHQCSIVWTLNDNSADRLLAADDNTFIQSLNEAYQYRLGEVSKVESRAAFPLHLRHANSYIQTGLALVGDAAHTIHPLAGQGVNIGLLDAATLAQVVIEAQQKQRDIGSLHTLQKYQRQRRADNLTMQLSMDLFKRTFSSDLTAVKWLRRSALTTVNRNALLKQFFIGQAAVRSFAAPKLSQKQY